MSGFVEATMIEPDHEENYDSDHEKQATKPPPKVKNVNRLTSGGGGGLGERRLSRVQDEKLRQALNIIRSGSQRELKEECIRQEWYQVSDETEKEILKDCVTDEAFWDEVKELARKELETEPQVLGEDQFRAMFREFDADNSGAIDAEELRKLLQQAMGMDCTREEVMDLMLQVDTDGNGEIDEGEFLAIMNAAKKQQESSTYRAQRDLLEEQTPLGQARKRRQSAFTDKSPPPASAASNIPIPNITTTPPPVRSQEVDLDSDEENLKLSDRLRRKASVTLNKNEKVSLYGRATVEEYKEMLKKTATDARKKTEDKKTTEDKKKDVKSPVTNETQSPKTPEPAITSPITSSPTQPATPTTTPTTTTPATSKPTGGISLSAALRSKKPAGYSSSPAGSKSPPSPSLPQNNFKEDYRDNDPLDDSDKEPRTIKKKKARSPSTTNKDEVPNFMKGTAASKPKSITKRYY